MTIPGISTSLFKTGNVKLAEKRAKEILELGALGLHPTDGLYSASIRDQNGEMILTFRIGVKDKEQAFACQNRFSKHPALIVCSIENFTIVGGDHYCSVSCLVSMIDPLPTPKQVELPDNEELRKSWLKR